MQAEAEPHAFASFREGFPALRAQTYLSICDKTILHDRVRASINVFLDHLAMASANRKDHEVHVASAKAKFAGLVNAPAETIAAIRNVSDGANTIAWAMPWREGDNVVLTVEAEHPNNIYPWLRLKTRGVECRMVAARSDGGLDIPAMIAAIDGRTRVMTCSSVTFAPGHRSDVARLGEACRKRDVFLLVDGVQSAGILRHDFDAEPIDGFVTSTSKGLLGLYGFGFLYASPRWIDRLEPAYLSRPAVIQGTDDHSAMGNFDFEFQPDSRRFEVGSFNLAGAYAADASLDLLLELGAERIEKRVLSLAAALHEGLTAIGLPPATPAGGPELSHIMTIGKLDAGGHGFSNDPLIGPLSAHMTDGKIVHTIRRGQLRLALHAYNNEQDVERTIACVSEGLAKARQASEVK
ncbi:MULTISPECIES: aminotransferase class V-fold PLP-dependent enzyme [Rhodomicrobium]|uniref:aminotransferase class V-fold PLP-dependent enzyme n=1 Tax=Rhodomicrobium TaxID=1068 RepID=UPI000B4B15AE|nr:MULTISPECIES: aminotransferase class V-fold PLP-dependent enzyme [Rhodomicrobium]